jgi:hypothetical protein
MMLDARKREGKWSNRLDDRQGHADAGGAPAQAIFDNFAQKTQISPEMWASGLHFCVELRGFEPLTS